MKKTLLFKLKRYTAVLIIFIILLIIFGFIVQPFSISKLPTIWGTPTNEESVSQNQGLSQEKLELLPESIQKGIDFLYDNQLAHGEFRALYCTSKDISNCGIENSNGFTTIVLYTLRDIDYPRIEEMKEKALAFLLSEQKPGGLWSFWTQKSKTQVPPDLDDTAAVSFALKDNNIPFEDNLDLILKNRNDKNLFYTWFSDDEDKNEVDCGVNTTAMLYLGKNDSDVCAYLNNAIPFDPQCTTYYQNRLTLFYYAARAFENSVTCLGKSGAEIIKQVLNFQIENGSFGNDLNTALAINTLLDFGYRGEEIDRGISYLLTTQSENGSWKSGAIFMAPKDRGTYTKRNGILYWSLGYPIPYEELEIAFYYGSQEVTTAIALEALNSYLSKTPK